jgi:hypothetical protein
VTTGFPDDSREEDERMAERRLRDLRSRVKMARAVVSTTPGLAEILARDWRRAARFYARFGITEAMFRHGVEGNSYNSAADRLSTETGADPLGVSFKVELSIPGQWQTESPTIPGEQ